MAENRDRRRDAAGVGPYARDAEQLVRLSDLGKWDVAEGEPDIRSWEVRTIGGRELGKISELLVDPDAGEVVMVDVDLSGSHQHALVPLRMVEIDRHARVVRMDSADLTATSDPDVASSAASANVQGGPEAPGRAWADSGRVRYPAREGERVVERRPLVEEVVVRRRVVGTDEHATSEEASETTSTQARRRDDDMSHEP